MKKKRYITPETIIIGFDTARLMSKSEVNDKPWADAKKGTVGHSGGRRGSDPWRQEGFGSQWDGGKSPWDD